jgi:hypothetical protein
MDMLDARGATYACRFFGLLALRMLRLQHEHAIGHYDIFLPNPVGEDRFNHKTFDGNVERLIPDYGVFRDRHVAVGLSSSGLMLTIATREADCSLDAGWRIPFAELHAEGADTASIHVGDVILRRLIALHPDAFAPFPNLIAPAGGSHAQTDFWRNICRARARRQRQHRRAQHHPHHRRPPAGNHRQRAPSDRLARRAGGV